MNNSLSSEKLNKETVLRVENLSVVFSMYKPHSIKKINLEVVHSLSLEVGAGEIVAVVGSSGSGKSILANSILGILPKNASIGGSITYHGDLVDSRLLKANLGKKIAYIPQSVDNLDPLMKIGKQVKGVYGSDKRVDELFEKYQLPLDTKNKYPHELSGGMARRALIAGALIGEPDLIIADEPTPGLSLDLAMETLKHFREIADNGTGILLITHDIDLALSVADKVAVFYSGTVVETAKKCDFEEGGDGLRHPYSKALFAALPQNGFKSIPGTMNYASDVHEGCVFYDRCQDRCDRCRLPQEERNLRGGKVRCINAV